MSGSATSPTRRPGVAPERDEAQRWLLRRLYYAQHTWSRRHGHYTRRLRDLALGELPPGLLMEASGDRFHALHSRRRGAVWHIREDGRIWADPVGRPGEPPAIRRHDGRGRSQPGNIARRLAGSPAPRPDPIPGSGCTAERRARRTIGGGDSAGCARGDRRGTRRPAAISTCWRGGARRRPRVSSLDLGTEPERRRMGQGEPPRVVQRQSAG